jgi:hypothetical protein
MQSLLESRAFRRVARHVYAPPRAAVQYVRALRINRLYEEHYREAQRAYSGDVSRVRIGALDEVGVRRFALEPGTGDLSLPSSWSGMVARCAAMVDDAFEQTSNCLFLPILERSSLPDRTSDVPAVQRREVLSLQLRDPLAVDAVGHLAEALVPQLEQRVYGSNVLVDKVYVYRNLVSTQAEQVSWLWHYDNHPTQILKVMVYLTEVDAGRAPFEYLQHQSTGQPYLFPPMPTYGDSRVAPRSVQSHLANGYKVTQLTGPPGTTALFDNNVLHRATLAETAHRDVVVFQFRPSVHQFDKCVDPRWTGGFAHVDFNRDPWDYSPRAKHRMLSA